jgi:hypothetical protein
MQQREGDNRDKPEGREGEVQRVWTRIVNYDLIGKETGFCHEKQPSANRGILARRQREDRGLQIGSNLGL